jgi:UDP-N-acetylglucosamine 1-carboxyvinyltransferase
MSKLIIRGGKRLDGEIRVAGMKNAATPIIAATLLTSEECFLDNIPRLSDVERMLDILRSLGAEVEWTGNNSLRICVKEINPENIDRKAVRALRSSVLLFGPLVARSGEVNISEPGGCIIGNRSLDTHLFALSELGAKISRTSTEYQIRSRGLTGANIILPEFSVTATENVLMAAVLASGKTVVKIAAAEPHVQDLVAFLTKMGAKIRDAGSHTIEILGVEKLHGARHTIIPDQIEAGTFAALGAVTRGTVAIRGVEFGHLDSVLSVLRRARVNLEQDGDVLKIIPANSLSAFRLQALPYPGFPTDLQAPFGVLATQAHGTSLIHDPLFEGRLGYIGELIKMGANAVVCDPHRVLISGPTPLYGTEIKSLDLRAGATMVIAGLVADGETIVSEAEVLDRGYENLDERLRALGAEIEKVD